jgi:hypothetical protein
MELRFELRALCLQSRHSTASGAPAVPDLSEFKKQSSRAPWGHISTPAILGIAKPLFLASVEFSPPNPNDKWIHDDS